MLQVYVKPTGKGNITVPKVQLVGIKRVFIIVGRGRSVNFIITKEQMAVWDDTKKQFVNIAGMKNINI